MSSPCINCGEIVEPERGDCGHFRKSCDACGHVGGPYVSDPDPAGGSDSGREQASITDF